jgi:hypothetical protein
VAEQIIDICGLRLGDNNRDEGWLLAYDKEHGSIEARHVGYGIPMACRRELNMIVQAAFNFGFSIGATNMGTMMDLITSQIVSLLENLQAEKSNRAPDPTSEANRALALAITKVEEAQLWLSKA